MIMRKYLLFSLFGLLVVSGCGPQRLSKSYSEDNLKQIGLAIMNYDAVYDGLPETGGTGSKFPTPGYSFRVAILPFVEQENLYKSVFPGGTPRPGTGAPSKDVWNNPKLLGHNVKLYNTDPTDPTKTNYRVIWGGGVYDEKGMPVTRMNLPRTNVILVVEAAESVVWTKPDELVYRADQPLPKFGLDVVGFNAVMLDGSTRWIPNDTPEAEIRKLITGGK